MERYMLQIFANRAVAQFNKAASTINSSYDVKENIRFSYWCKFYGENPDEQATDIQLIDASVYNALESKSSVAKQLKKHGIEDVFPATFTSVEDALAHKDPVDIWFVKPSHLSGGRGIQVIAHQQLKDFELPKFNILQAGIENLGLIDGRKAVGRVYVLLWNGGVYLFDEGFILLHGPKYQKGSTDYSVQVDHKGYEDTNSAVTLTLASEYKETKGLADKAKTPLRKILPILQDTLKATSPTRYIMLGIDVMPLDNGEVKFIEINAIPNFNHNANVNTHLNTPFFTEAIKGMIGLGSDRLTKITGSAFGDSVRKVFGKKGL